MDVLISGGKLIDGTGTPWRYADVGISGGQITALGRLTNCQAAHTIDARDAIVCPGFVDVHSHADLSLMAGRWVEGRLLQGITTEVFTTDDLTRSLGGSAELPRRLRGDEGPDDRAVPPWAWRCPLLEERRDREDRHRRRRDDYVEEGDLFVDPARTLDLLFRLPDDVSRHYVLNPFMASRSASGISAHLPGR